MQREIDRLTDSDRQTDRQVDRETESTINRQTDRRRERALADLAGVNARGLTSQQQAQCMKVQDPSWQQYICCHTETKAADQSYHFTQSAD